MFPGLRESIQFRSVNFGTWFKGSSQHLTWITVSFKFQRHSWLVVFLFLLVPDENLGHHLSKSFLPEILSSLTYDFDLKLHLVCRWCWCLWCCFTLVHVPDLPRMCSVHNFDLVKKFDFRIQYFLFKSQFLIFCFCMKRRLVFPVT